MASTTEGKLINAAKKLAEYLHILLAVEYDVDAIDRLAKSRRLDEFKENVYNALRRKLTLESKLSELEKRGHGEAREALSKVRDLGPEDIDSLMMNINDSQLRGWATFIGSRALASTSLFTVLRKLIEGGE